MRLRERGLGFQKLPSKIKLGASQQVNISVLRSATRIIDTRDSLKHVLVSIQWSLISIARRLAEKGDCRHESRVARATVLIYTEAGNTKTFASVINHLLVLQLQLMLTLLLLSSLIIMVVLHATSIFLVSSLISVPIALPTCLIVQSLSRCCSTVAAHLCWFLAGCFAIWAAAHFAWISLVCWSYVFIVSSLSQIVFRLWWRLSCLGRKLAIFVFEYGLVPCYLWASRAKGWLALWRWLLVSFYFWFLGW